ncbi:unnamed protein product [Allacma fusca]|uniref:Uncharacterized protein n=1 Tax=Allacma fusca TaxID=39272 RepID=A0A8J2L5Q3_9HEXA|nr:unnamed protein product [Allacma fusca]
MIFVQDSSFDFVPWMKGIRKDFLVITNTGKNTKEYKFGVDEDCQNDFRCILRKQRVKIGYSPVKPYFVINDSLKEKDGSLPSLNLTPRNINSVGQYFSGVETELVKILVETYDIAFTLVPSFFGMELPNGTWTGKFAFLVDKNVDIIAACLPGNYRRNTIGVYSSQIYVVRFTLTSLGPLTWWITKTHHRILAREKEFTQSAFQISGQAILTLVVEPWKNPPHGPASFILTGWFLACLILQCIYSSNLTASFSIQEYQKPVDTFEDAKALSKTVLIKLGTTPSLFLNEESPEASFKVVETSQEFGVNALDDFNNVGTHEHQIFRHKVIMEGRKMSEFHISRPFLTIFAGWIYSKDFKFKDAFNIAILKIDDAGLIQKWTENQFANGSIKDSIEAHRSHRTNSQQYNFRILGMDHLKAVFDFWVAGMILSVIIFAVEYITDGIIARCKACSVSKRQEYSYLN